MKRISYFFFSAAFRLYASAGRRLSPAGLYLMRDLVQQIIIGAPNASGTAIRSEAEEDLAKILTRIQLMEQALSLKEDFPRLGLGQGRVLAEQAATVSQGGGEGSGGDCGVGHRGKRCTGWGGLSMAGA